MVRSAHRTRAAALALVGILGMGAVGACSSGAGGEAVLQSGARLTTALVATDDTHVRSGTPNQNYGALTSLRLQSSGSNRALVRFSTSDLANLTPGTAATLKLTISDNGDNWGTTGRPIAIHRLTHDWTELGATWSCAIDSDTSNSNDDCSGETAWEMGKPSQPELHPWDPTATATATITNGQTGEVTFDVTADVALFQSGTATNFGWILKKVDEGAAGRVEFASRETATPPVVAGTCTATDDSGVCSPSDAGDASSSDGPADADESGADAGADGDADADDTNDGAAPCEFASCDDGNACTTDTCTSSGCAHAPVGDGTSCSDGNLCTSGDQCIAGACTSGAAVDPDDGNPCTSDSCDPAQGVTHAPRAAGDTACSNGNPCDGVETCDGAGACVAGAPLVLEDGNPCTVDACDPILGAVHAPAPAGTSCGDGNVCNGEELCDGAGLCLSGAPPSVDDANPCTVDSCDPVVGAVHTPAAIGTSCADGNACNGAEACDGNGACAAGTPPVVDDGNPCTADACDPAAGVTHTPLPAGDLACSNGDACDGVETCNGAGACVQSPAPAIDDGNVCTLDACSPITGPYHTPLAGCDPTTTAGEAPLETRASVVGKLVSSTGDPISGATFTVYDERALGAPRSDVEVRAPGDGSFRLRFTGFPEVEPDRTPPHRFVIDIDAPNELRAQRVAYAHPGDVVDLGSIKLVERDPKITMVGPDGGIATDSRGLMEVSIPAGALTTTVPIQITPLTSRDDFPAPLPDATITMYGVVLEPSGTTFATPAKLRATNYRNFPTSLSIPSGVYDEIEGRWDHDGFATWNGTKFEVSIAHFSERDINAAHADDLVVQSWKGNSPNQGKALCGTGSSYRIGNGSIEQAIPLPSTRVRGDDFGLTFHYASGLAGSLKLGSAPSSDGQKASVPTGSLAVSVGGPRMKMFCVPHGVDPPASSVPGQCTSVQTGGCGPGAGASLRGVIGMVAAENAAVEALDRQIREWEIGGWMNVPAEGDNVAAPGFLTQSIRVSGGTIGTCAGSGATFGVSDPKAPRVQLSSTNDGPLVSFPHKPLVHHRFDSPLGSGWGIGEVSRVYRTGDIAAIVHGDGQEEDFHPRATATALSMPFGPTVEHVYARDLSTGEIFVAYAPSTIAKMDPATGATTPVVSGASLNAYLFSMAVTHVGGARHFVVATDTRLVDVTDDGVTRQLATRSNPYPGARGFYGQASVAAWGDLVFYTDGREDSKTMKRLRLTDATPTLADASTSAGQQSLYPTTSLGGFQFENPHGLAFGPDGVLYVADPRRHAVYRVLPDPTTSEVGPNSAVQLGLGSGGGAVSTAVGERYPALGFSINQPVSLTIGEDGVVLVLNDYGVTAYDPVAKEAETLFLDGGRDELSSELVNYFNNPHSFVALDRWSLFTRRATDRPVRIDVAPLSSERDPMRTITALGGGGYQLIDKTAGTISLYDAAGRLIEQRERTGETVYSVTYADARTMKIDRITNAVGGQWVFAYSNGKLASITDPAGAETVATVDERGDLVSLRFADGELHGFSYDKHKMVSKTSPAGDVNSYTYNEDGTAKQAVKSSGETHTFTAVLANKGTYASDGSLVESGSYVDSHGVRHDIVMNTFGDVEKDTYTADGTSYDKSLVYAGDLAYSPSEGTLVVPRKNAMLRVTNTTLNGVPLSGPLKFDSFGRPVSQQASPGAGSPSTELRGWRYDANGWLSNYYEIASGSFPYFFDRDAAGHVVRAHQDSNTAGPIRETLFTWRSDGLPATVTTHGVTTTFGYDASGNVASTSDTVGRTSTLGYDARGNVTFATDGTASSTYAFDDANRLLEARDAQDNATAFRYTRTDCGCSERDLVTGIHTSDLPFGEEWTFDYGPDGRVSAVTDPHGYAESYTYETTGELKSLTDRSGRTTAFQHDQLGRLLSMVDAASRKQARTYPVPTSGAWTGPMLTAASPDGVAAATSLSNGLREGEYQIGLNVFGVDGRPARISVYRDATFALAYRRDFSDQEARLTKRIDRIEKPIDSVELTNNDKATINFAQWSYDIRSSAPLVTSVSVTNADGSGSGLNVYRNSELDVTQDTGLGGGFERPATATYTRDVAGRVTVQANRLSPIGDTYGAHYTYRSDGRVSSATSADGASVSQTSNINGTTWSIAEGKHDFTYDGRGLVATQTDFDGTYEYSYDAAGRNTRLVYPDGHVRVQAYDEVGRLTSRCYEYGGGSFCYTATYDPVGNPVQLTDPEGSDVVEYDALDRVKKVTRTDGSGVPVGEETYAYNALGALSMNAGVAMDHQRPRLDGGGVAASAVPATLGGQPVTLDLGGRIKSARGVSFAWNSDNVLTGEGDMGIGANASRYRVWKLGGASNANEYYVYEGANRIAQLEKSGTFRPGWLKSTWLFDGVDHPLRLSQPDLTQSGSTSTLKPKAVAYYEVDLAGNVRRLRAPGGGDLGGYRYTAFGKTVENTAVVEQPLRWKGRPYEVLGGLELYDMRARQWAPELGTFLSIDEYAFHDAKSTLWGWPGQNPIRFRDPSGHWGDDDPRATRWGDYAVNHLDEPGMQAHAVAGAGVFGALGAGPFLVAEDGIALWGTLQEMGPAGRIITALLGAPVGAAVDLDKKSAPTALPGQLTGGAGDCVKKTKESIDTFGGTPINPGWPHWANKLPSGMVHDPTLRGNLIERGAYVGDIPDQQTMFTMEEWVSLTARVN